MNESGKYKIVKVGQTPQADPGATSRPVISTDGFLLVKTAGEFASGAGAEPLITNIIDDGTYTYVGNAVVGSADSDVVWTIVRIENATGSTRYANAGAQVAWDNGSPNVYDEYTYS